jgi:hypothetical protein
LGGEGYGNARPLGLSDGAFDGHVVYFSVIISGMALGVKISVGTSSDCEDCAVAREGIILLLGFFNLWQGGGGMALVLT